MTDDLFKLQQKLQRHHAHADAAGQASLEDLQPSLLLAALKDQTTLNGLLRRQLDKLYELTRIGSWTLDPLTACFHLSKEAQAVLELSARPLLPLADFASLISDELVFRNAIESCLSHGLAVDKKLGLRTAKGNMRWVHLAAEADVIGERVVRINGTIQDISDQHAQTIALHESEARFREMVASLSDGFVTLSGAPLRISHVTESMVEISGYAEASYLNLSLHTFYSHVHPDDSLALYDALRLAEERKDKQVRLTFRAKHANGSYYWREDQATLSYDDRVGLSKIFIICRDVSQHVEAEEALLKAKEEAQHANKIKSDFLSSMSHELRTPMTGVLGMTELLLETQLDDEQRDFAETAYGSGRSLLTLLNDVLDFSRLEADRMPITLCPANIKQMAEEACLLMSAAAEKKGLVLLLDFDANCPPTVTVDVDRLRQVLLNLLGNAIKFTNVGTVIVSFMATQIGKSSSGRGHWELQIAVRDSGIGIPKSEQASLFDAFTQVIEVNHKTEPGTGLGLAITHKLVTLMGGRLELDSAPQQGSTFTATLEVDGPQVPCARACPSAVC